MAQTNLQEAMRRKQITVRTMAALIGTAEKTVRNKINGFTDFTFDEAELLQRELFPEYDIRYLFKKDRNE